MGGNDGHCQYCDGYSEYDKENLDIAFKRAALKTLQAIAFKIGANLGNSLDGYLRGVIQEHSEIADWGWNWKKSRILTQREMKKNAEEKEAYEKEQKCKNKKCKRKS